MKRLLSNHILFYFRKSDKYWAYVWFWKLWSSPFF